MQHFHYVFQKYSCVIWGGITKEAKSLDTKVTEVVGDKRFVFGGGAQNDSDTSSK